MDETETLRRALKRAAGAIVDRITVSCPVTPGRIPGRSPYDPALECHPDAYKDCVKCVSLWLTSDWPEEGG